MTDALWVVLLIAVSIAMMMAARTIEPHTVSKDGRSFTCRIQSLSTDGRTVGRWSEAKALVVDDRIVLTQRSFRPTRREPQRPRRVLTRAQGAPPRFAIFVAEGDEGLYALRVPAKSAAVAVLDDLIV